MEEECKVQIKATLSMFTTIVFTFKLESVTSSWKSMSSKWHPWQGQRSGGQYLSGGLCKSFPDRACLCTLLAQARRMQSITVPSPSRSSSYSYSNRSQSAPHPTFEICVCPSFPFITLWVPIMRAGIRHAAAKGPQL